MKKQPKPGPDKKSVATTLMNRSNRLKSIASQQEGLGKAQIKNNVKPGQTGTLGQFTGKIRDAGKPIPVGQQRLDIAKKLRQEASRDSLRAVKIYPAITPRKKK